MQHVEVFLSFTEDERGRLGGCALCGLVLF